MDNYEIKCTQCEKTFSKNSNLLRHIRNIHGDQVILENTRLIKCMLCSSTCLSKKALEDHLSSVHDIHLVKDNIEFETYEDFLAWKEIIEKEGSCNYVKERGSYKKGNLVTSYFSCHRSGYFKSKGNGQRAIKTAGTNKVNGTCPSMMKVFQDGVKITVEFVKTHVGHCNDIGRLRLNKTEKDMIASKLLQNIPIDDILDEIRDSINDKLEPVHLLTRKDVINLKTKYGIHRDGILHSSDKVSVTKWVEKLMNTENSPIVLFKNQGVYDEKLYPNLNQDDFLLVIMNTSQREMLKLYGNDCICLDFTHGMNAYKFDLATVLILDDKREGFPAAFIISNRQDSSALTVAFNALKQHVNISPKILMSDDSESFYNAWQATFGEPGKKLLCSWHVDRSWRKKLSQLITNTEQQTEVYKILRTLLSETDEVTFKLILHAALDYFEETDCFKEFGRYFKSTYVGRCETWAYCFRKWAGINTNMHIERMHRTIKHIYLKGKKVKRLDKTLHCLMKFVKDKIFDRLITVEKGKISSKISNLRNRHKVSTTITAEIHESDNNWKVESSSRKGEFYIIKKNDLCSSQCTLLCKDCGFCLHNFTCTCLDNAIQWNMCKHIHLVCSKLLCRSNNEVEELSDISINSMSEDVAESLVIDEDASLIDEDASILSSLPFSTTKPDVKWRN